MHVIVYHDDNDGRCAAAITLRALQERIDPLTTMFVPATYDKAAAIVNAVNPGNEVFVVDFSFSEALFTDLVEKAPQTVWIDHHKSAIEQLDGTMISALPGLRNPYVACSGTRRRRS